MRDTHRIIAISTRDFCAQRFEILDAIRFFAALWVVIGHYGGFPIGSKQQMGAFSAYAHGIYNNFFSGPAAVIVFFVISGFCIHFPFRQINHIPLLNYFTRRFIRILVPMGCAMVVARPAGVPMFLFRDSVLWSLFAELIYYTFYPFLHYLARRIGWPLITKIGFLGSFCLLVAHPLHKDYATFGTEWNWLLALPCWLLGCILAETYDTKHSRSVPLATLYLARITAWIVSVVCSILRFHSPIGYPWTLTLFSILVFAWLKLEILNRRKLPRPFIWAGNWTYSLYLTHLIPIEVCSKLAQFQSYPSELRWCLEMISILVTAYIFYFCFERPSHYLARLLARRLEPTLVKPFPVLAANEPVAGS